MLADPASAHQVLEDLPTNSATLLQAALQLPSANRRIAKWLFANKDSQFHSDGLLIPPAAFSNSLILCVDQQFIQREPSSPADSSADPPPKPMSADPTLSTYILLLPTERVEGIVVGYSLAVGSLVDSRLHPFDESDLPWKHTHSGRFAFDRSQRHIVCVKHDITTKTTAIYTVNWYRRGRRQRCYISIPNHQYSFDKPPTTVMSITIHTEFKHASLHNFQDGSALNMARTLASPLAATTADRDPQNIHPDDFRTGVEGPWSGADIRSLHPNVLYDFSSSDQTDSSTHDFWGQTYQLCSSPCSRPSWKSIEPSPDCDKSPFKPPPRQVRPLFDMRTVAASSTSKSPPDIRDTRRHLRDVDETATGQFDSASIVACLEDLENSLEGRFFSPKIYQGRPDPVTGELSLSEIGHMCATFVCGDKSKHEALKKMAAQSYYAGVLPALGNECKPSSQ